MFYLSFVAQERFKKNRGAPIPNFYFQFYIVFEF